MFLQGTLSSTLLLLCLSKGIDGVIFDASCSEYEEKLKPAFTSAFEMAAWAASDLGGTIQPRLAAVVGLLWGDSSQWVEGRTGLGNVHLIPSTFSNNAEDTSNPNDIIVYCSLDRYEETYRPDHTLFDAGRRVFQSVTDEDFQACKTGVHPTGGKRTKAITTNYYSLDLQRPPVLTTMDLCPWYLEYIKSAEWNTPSDVSREGSPTLGTIWNSLKQVGQAILPRFDKTQIDASALADHTILHEMTHSKAVGIP